MARTLEKTIRVDVRAYGELSAHDMELVRQAAQVRHNAQAPYSNYLVGVAARFEGGILSVGVNHEVASWSQTTHGEQTAIAAAVARYGPIKLTDVAVVGAPRAKLVELPPAVERPIAGVEDVCPSCGHCLQIIWEQCGGDKNVRLLQLHAGGEIAITTIGDALPMAFGPAELGIDIFAE